MAGRPAGEMGVEITLFKSIPVAAGLGGGSSDAAAVLRGLGRLYGERCSTAALVELGVQLGADVPFFLVDWPAAWATGIGERLQPAVPLAGYRLVLVNPGFPVSTAWVYKNFALTERGKNFNLQNLYKDKFDRQSDPAFTRRAIRPDELSNNLETVTISRYRELDGIKRKLLKCGAAAALMSGSGPSVFGLFPEFETEKAVVCCGELQREYHSTFLIDPLASQVYDNGRH
jgi:4-diphosphocytidyl-2-C-methyl-D-erythritol kinase